MSDQSKWMIYGANGYSGRLAALRAKELGMTPVLAGRNREAVEAVGAETGFETRIFSLDRPADAQQNLEDMKVLLLCAGPFSATSRPALDACAKTGTHYLDITGEIDVFEYVHQNDRKWKEAGIVAMPGTGFDVVPSDCLAAMLARELPDATHLRMAFKSKHGKLSPGTTKTMIEGLAEGGKVRKEGKLVSVPPAYKKEMIKFEDGPHLAVTIPWGDVSTAYYSTGIPNIEIYIGSTEKQIGQMRSAGRMTWLLGIGAFQNLSKALVKIMVKGPTQAQRDRDEMQLWGEVRNDAGKSVTIRMRTPEGYGLTAVASVLSAKKLLEGDVEPGAKTPSMAFGADFVTEMEGVEVYAEALTA